MTDRSAHDVWANVLQYYSACIESEGSYSDLLSRSGTRKKYVFRGGRPETLICGLEERLELTPDEVRLAEATQAKGESLVYGYPIVVYEQAQVSPSGRRGTKRQMAPLLAVEMALPPLGQPILRELRPAADPVLHPEVTARLGLKAEEVAALVEARPIGDAQGSYESMLNYLDQLVDELGLNAFNEVHPGELDEESEAAIAGAGLHNVAMLYRAKSPVYNQRLLQELGQLVRRWPEASKTAARFLLERPNVSQGQSQGRVVEPLPLNDGQRAALASAMTNPLTVVTGPPGTGKSQLVAAAVASCWVNGSSVLVASTNNQAVDVATERAAAVDPGLLIRTGSRERREAANEHLRSLASRRQTHADPEVLSKSVDKARTALQEAMALVRQRTADEAALAEALLSLEVLASHLPASALALLRPDVRAAVRKARRVKKARFFRNFRRARYLKSLQLSTEPKVLDDALDFLELAVKATSLEERLESVPPMRTLHRSHIKALADLHTASAALTRAVIAGSFLRGSRELRAFTSARARYGSFDALQSALKNLLPSVKGWATTTLSAGATFPLNPALFDLVIIDEASQCSIPDVIPLLFRARRAMIIGDPNQLQHIATLSPAADTANGERHGLNKEFLTQKQLQYTRSSTFHVLAAKVLRVFLLDEHYRSHPDIIGISNKLFYQGALTVLTDPERLRFRKPDAVSWRDVRGTCYRPESGSLVNQTEAEAVADEVAAIAGQDREASLGVVTPFSAQARVIASLLETRLSPDIRERVNLMVGTAHRFQGDERDVMVFSPTAAPGVRESTLRWMSGTPNLLNVAITRARSYLLVVGHREYCSEAEGLLGELARAIRDLEVSEHVDAASHDGLLHSEAERRLFEALAQSGLTPLLKRRVCGYECDFYVESASIAVDIECDGVQHLDEAGRQRLQDLSRDDLLRVQGVEVIRVPAWRCVKEPHVVASDLVRAVERFHSEARV